MSVRETEIVKGWLCIAMFCACCTLIHCNCWHNGFHFQPGPFQPEPCLSCFCFDHGATDCFVIQCPTCLFYYYKPGDCCATCEPPPNPTTPAVPLKHKAEGNGKKQEIEREID